jgi:hypothetical protein
MYNRGYLNFTIEKQVTKSDSVQNIMNEVPEGKP